MLEYKHDSCSRNRICGFGNADSSLGLKLIGELMPGGLDILPEQIHGQC